MLPTTGSTITAAMSGPCAIARRHTAHVADHRLDDHRRNVWAVFVEDLFERGRVVEGRGDRVVRDRRRDAGAVWKSERRDARTCFDEQAVAVGVVAALELDDLVPRGRAAREAKGGHR